MPTIERFEDLEMWKKARELSSRIYKLTFTKPICDDYRLIGQMRGAAGSIMDNIAEGFERGSRLEFINSLGIAKGETGELKSQLYRSSDAGYLSEQQFNELFSLTEEVAKMIAAFIAYLNQSIIKGHKFKDRT